MMQSPVIKDAYLDRSRVLYVEDEDVIRESVARFLRRRIKELHVASNGKEGLDLFKELRADIIITDIRMPVMDGLEMASAIKEIDLDVPIVITTAYNDEEFFIKAIDLGVDKYIKKPINNKDLLNILTKLARSISQQKEIEAKNEFILTVLDNNPAFLMITDGDEITFLNKSFLNFMDAASLEEFRGRDKTINNYLVLKEEVFYKGKAFNEWIREVFDQKGGEHIVHMTGPGKLKSEAGSYLVYATSMPDMDDRPKYLVTFTDISHIEMQRKMFHEMSIKDPLTNAYNRKKFNDELDKEIERSIRYCQSLAMIFFDIDHFKKINDTYGHQTGDYVLQEITTLVCENIRLTDILARYGGEEFVILTPATTLKGAKEMAEKLRDMIETHHFRHVDKVTCSFGVSEYESQETAQSFIKKADYALYIAKNQGRNRVRAMESEHSLIITGTE